MFFSFEASGQLTSPERWLEKMADRFGKAIARSRRGRTWVLALGPSDPDLGSIAQQGLLKKSTGFKLEKEMSTG